MKEGKQPEINKNSPTELSNNHTGIWRNALMATMISLGLGTAVGGLIASARGYAGWYMFEGLAFALVSAAGLIGSRKK